MLTRLIYSSVADRRLDLVDLQDISHASVVRNLSQHVTGMLISYEDRFLQVLEGQRTNVSNTLARIWRDERHRDINVISSMDIKHRIFDGWAVGHVGNGARSKEIVEAYLPGGKTDFQLLPAPQILELVLNLKTLVENQTSQILAMRRPQSSPLRRSAAAS